MIEVNIFTITIAILVICLLCSLLILVIGLIIREIIDIYDEIKWRFRK